ncbi:tRNA (guanine-N(7)-)-methyltransferase [Striga asiatica]|uniref:tRNA (Guanine-N(7)-)-methyltransferase n=1 Tax=Striga asiatica TaxID=4170 RepID=A0A5A7Q9M3_STRAF|nr:tRNA (guanine-N(7)-)-methyltransferase [Striga asiatica]
MDGPRRARFNCGSAGVDHGGGGDDEATTKNPNLYYNITIIITKDFSTKIPTKIPNHYSTKTITITKVFRWYRQPSECLGGEVEGDNIPSTRRHFNIPVDGSVQELALLAAGVRTRPAQGLPRVGPRAINHGMALVLVVPYHRETVNLDHLEIVMDLIIPKGIRIGEDFHFSRGWIHYTDAALGLIRRVGQNKANKTVTRSDHRQIDIRGNRRAAAGVWVGHDGAIDGGVDGASVKAAVVVSYEAEDESDSGRIFNFLVAGFIIQMLHLGSLYESDEIKQTRPLQDPIIVKSMISSSGAIGGQSKGGTSKGIGSRLSSTE